MEISIIFIILTEVLVLCGNTSSVKTKKSCQPWEVYPGNQSPAKISQSFKIICKARTEEKCPKERMIAKLYKNNLLLGELSEAKRVIEYKYTIKHIKMSDAGIYYCVISNSHGVLNKSITVEVSGESPNSYRFLPADKDQIKRDELYLRRSMENVAFVKHFSLGSLCRLECQFYCPQTNVSLNAYWKKHKAGMNYDSGTLLSSYQQVNITRTSDCDMIGDINATCVYSRLQVMVTENDLFTCVVEAENETLRSAYLTFSVMVDATTNKHGKSGSYHIEFTSNSTVCLGQNFTFFCASEDPKLIMYLYKIHPSVDLRNSEINLTTSNLLMMYSEETDTPELSKEDRAILTTNIGFANINYTLVSASEGDSGRYICVIQRNMPMEVHKWKTMHLSTAYCGLFSYPVIVFCTISLFLIVVIIVFVSIMVFLNYKNNRLKRLALRKAIIIEYESPIYKGIFHSSKNFKSNRFHSQNYLPDSYPIMTPIIKIKPIKGSEKQFRGRSYGEELPSTSTYRTRLESAHLSSQSDNEVFESNHSDYQFKFKPELEKSSSISFNSMYEFPRDQQWEFPREKLKITSRKLGEGAFGMVYEGTASDICDRIGLTKVGVKMMKENFSDSNVLDFMKEIEIMKQIGVHRHVIQLLGVCTQNGPLHVIVEFAPYGNLRDFLRSNGYRSRKSFKYQSTLHSSTLCKYALQIAQGMTYLSSRSIVHRDLSARNILVGEDYDMKIADFGLTRIVDYYYRKKSDGILPIKWMSPEALLQKKYTTKSDVWSYGILLWEIFSLGDNPYASALPENIITLIQKGVQNPQPVMANTDIYQLMQQCWHLLNEDRPHFYQIVIILADILTRLEDEPEFNIYQSDTLYLEMESGYLEPKGSVS